MNKRPLALFQLCCDSVLTKCDNLNPEDASKLLNKFSPFIIEDIFDRAIQREKGFGKGNVWKDAWRIFLIAGLRRAFIPWDEHFISSLDSQNLVLIYVVCCEQFDSSFIKKIPASVQTLIFDIDCKMSDQQRQSWLPEAEKLLKSMLTKKMALQRSENSLTEVDMETISATSADLQVILSSSPGLKYLRHYQMTKALYDYHQQDWKKNLPMPKYKLRNLDADFSHVIRCRMSPEWVLAPDALQLATVLCPQATTIRLRFDCSTPNDVLAALVNLEAIQHFSAVCVSSGERTNLDFSDMVPILEKFGPTTLRFLELKVIEEVEAHVVILWCTALETLILSGCGYVTPPSCPSYACHEYAPGSFASLKHLFFADGDDFSWDHGAPECFWRAALLPSGKRGKSLKGLFLEMPRIPDALTAEIFRRNEKCKSLLPFPDLQVATFCRYNELSLQDVVSLCGLEGTTNPPLSFLRISESEQWNAEQEKLLQGMFKLGGLDCTVMVDALSLDAEEKRHYTYKIGRSGR